jgi:hypothetical protein
MDDRGVRALIDRLQERNGDVNHVLATVKAEGRFLLARYQSRTGNGEPPQEALSALHDCGLLTRDAPTNALVTQVLAQKH